MSQSATPHYAPWLGWLLHASALFRLIPPETRGKMRMARLLLAPILTLTGIEVCDRFANHLRIASVGESVGFQLLINGVYGMEEMRFILDHLVRGSTFVDVGANIGCYSLPAAQRVAPNGRVLSIEASPKILSLLQTNVERNHASNVTIVPVAASDRDGIVSFYAAPSTHAGMGSLAPRFVDGEIYVPARPVDSILTEARVDQVHLMKVDVEGFEAAVFRGSRQLLTSDTPPIVLFEFNDWAEEQADFAPGDAQQQLREWSYTLWRLDDYQHRRPPLAAPIVSGSEMLVARRQVDSRAAGGGTR